MLKCGKVWKLLKKKNTLSFKKLVKLTHRNLLGNTEAYLKFVQSIPSQFTLFALTLFTGMKLIFTELGSINRRVKPCPLSMFTNFYTK